jgi:hypothetical protein
MNYFYLFLVVGIAIVFLIVQYDKQNRKKVNEILRANKNVPPLFMLRSAELKIVAIKAALNKPGYVDAEYEQAKAAIGRQLDKLVDNYKNREIALAAYYTKLGALLISINELKAANAAEVHVHA